ncbi:hypothetical protein FLONG3_7882 [Fusarium longipes]|uniref:Uncharacterized protein n=1 Tax=Fusarium longipes TaxID=694270 RepID=A0A395SA02_9HYPO|nr:hypothetical protein FLONG3_7882 [Fusarium longipes]
MAATLEINDAVFCEEHIAEVTRVRRMTPFMGLTSQIAKPSHAHRVQRVMEYTCVLSTAIQAAACVSIGKNRSVCFKELLKDMVDAQF